MSPDPSRACRMRPSASFVRKNPSMKVFNKFGLNGSNVLNDDDCASVPGDPLQWRWLPLHQTGAENHAPAAVADSGHGDPALKPVLGSGNGSGSSGTGTTDNVNGQHIDD